MASLHIGLKTMIDYSIIDGRVREFMLDGVLLYDEQAGCAVEGWREMLGYVIRSRGLYIDDGRGLHAFVIRWLEEQDGQTQLP